MIEKTRVDFLRDSSKKFGYLYPVLVDEDGKVIDGRHRLQADKNWVRKEVKADKLKALLLKGTTNWLRWTGEEKTEFLDELGKATSWKSAKPFAEELGLNERTIARYLPDKYKVEEQAVRRRGKTLEDSLSSEELEMEEDAKETADFIINTYEKALKNNRGKPRLKEKSRALSNRLKLGVILQMLNQEQVFCPHCKKSGTLVWSCCKRSVKKAHEELLAEEVKSG